MPERYDGWIVCWKHTPCWWTASRTRREAIGHVFASTHVGGRSWPQLRRAGWSARRLAIEDDRTGGREP